MTAARYSVAPRSPAEVRPDLERLWDANLSFPGGTAAKFDWTYRATPQPSPAVYMLAFEGEVVGTAGIFERSFQLGDRSGRAALLGDLAVGAAHRSAQPALQTLRAVRQDAFAGHDLVYSFPNRKANALFRRAGYQELGRLERHVVVLRHAGYARRLTRLPLVARLGGALVDVAALLRRSPRALAALRDYRVRWDVQPDARFDRLWASARAEYRVVGQRDAAFLRWRARSPASPPSRFVLLSRRADDEPMAYAAVSQDPHGAAALTDVFGHWVALGPLLDVLLPLLYARGATSCAVSYLGASRFIELIGSRGFVARELTRTVYYEPGAGLAAERELLRDKDSWHLLPFDEDT